MRKLLFYFPLLVLLAAASCRKTGDNVVVDPTSPAAAQAQLAVLRDTVNVRWQRMIDSDNQKLVATTAVLQTLKQLPGTDKTQADQLRAANDQLLGLRYDQKTMAESAKIDAYDNAQTQVLNAVYDLARPQLERSQDVQALTETIKEADSQVIGFRVRYDQAAKKYNQYLQLHGATLKKAGRKYSNLQPLPLFELQP
ncbi:LemA family protein [Hymenobacter sp. 15J16-1T3B]|uniref:LemA family protein n=1 Tax=Hymenobacter sp. 15J16-1T3B TaxID=2886941 RepID=UPI001D11D80E|nr:LemA family protein [Hymenobacter sp. 15J16-1T3B]MCC3159445.1 LemA family protein [Hymenobacter sp. 15J16-1T3B]